MAAYPKTKMMMMSRYIVVARNNLHLFIDSPDFNIIPHY
jgi:hypothetical protein